MIFILINETKKDLSQADYMTLWNLTKDFYSNIPPGIRMLGDYNTMDKTKNFAIIEADSINSINDMKSRFEKYVNIQVIPVESSDYSKKNQI